LELRPETIPFRRFRVIQDVSCIPSVDPSLLLLASVSSPTIFVPVFVMKALLRRTLLVGLAAGFLASGRLAAQDLSDIAAATRELRQTLRDLDKRVSQLEKLLNREANERKKQRPRVAKSTTVTPTRATPIRIDPAADLVTGQDLYRRARIEEAGQQYEKAIDLYTQAVRFDPRNDLSFLHRGISNFHIGRLDQALSDANESLAIQPNSAQTYGFRGNVYLTTKSFDQALSDLREAVIRDPKNPDYLIAQASIEEDRGNFSAAVELYEKASSLRPESAEILVKNARVLRQINDLARSVERCNRAIALAPMSPEGYVCRAESNLRNGALPKAVEDLNQAFQLGPTLPEVARLLPSVREMIHVNEDFVKMTAAQKPIIEQPLAAVETPARAASEPLASADVVAPAPSQQLRTQPAAASESLRRTIPEPKDSREALRDGRKSIENGLFVAALAPLGRAISLDPSSAVAYNSRGYAYLRTHQYDLAILDFSTAISINSAYANAYWNRSVARRLRGDVLGSRKDVELATRLGYPTNIVTARRQPQHP
jgi:tetratricopeptide (TPR) repeat protein